MEEVIVSIKLNSCRKCPHCWRERTIDAGYAFDYFCGARNDQVIVEYVEYPSEFPDGIPRWCPFREENKEDAALA